MKKRILALILPVLFSGMLVSCNGNETQKSNPTLDAPTNLKFDFNTSTYSFTGSPNATFYSLKVYQFVDGTLDSHAVASSGMIRATEANTDYSGTLDYDFNAGDYRAVVKAIAPRYKTNQTQFEGKSTMLGAPEVEAKFNDPNSSGGWPGGPGGGPGPMGAAADPGAGEDEEKKEVTIDITIEATDKLTVDYTLIMTNTATNTTVYQNDHVTAGALNLKASDLKDVATITTDDKYSVSVQGNAVEGYLQRDAVVVEVEKSRGSPFPPF